MCRKRKGLPRIQEVCSQAALFLKQAGIEAYRLEAELLLGLGLAKDRKLLLMNAMETVSPEEEKRFQALLDERAAGTPIQYLLGRVEFMGREYVVQREVLIPRDDTAVLVESALEKLQGMRSPRVLDLCTGTGIVGITLSLERKTPVLATDISEKALAVARTNAHSLGALVEFRLGDLFGALRSQDGPFDLIVSNPPYISAGEMDALQREVKEEPRLALYGGEDGLDVYRRIVREAPAHLKPGGWLIFEIGWKQGEAVLLLLEEAGFTEGYSKKDMAGHDRVVGARRRV